jgi:hypothetical protein
MGYSIGEEKKTEWFTLNHLISIANKYVLIHIVNLLFYYKYNLKAK